MYIKKTLGLLFGILLTVHLHAQLLTVVKDRFNDSSETSIKLPARIDTGLVKENLGAAVNTPYAEIHPVVSADGRNLYFARAHSPQNTGGVNDKQDIWFSHTEDGIRWSKSKNMGKTINTSKADNLTAVTADNNTMMFYNPGVRGKGSFGLRKRKPQGWSDMEVLNIKLRNESEYLESCLSADGTVILFTAKTKRNVMYQPDVDERDIYVSFKKQNNKWTKPVNLGPKLNSPGDEYTPFLAADGRTLYFATNGRPGYGGVDIFMSKRRGNSWTDWTEPINMGPEINTPLFDAYYTLPASGKYAYMVSYINGFGDADIVRIKVPEVMKPEPVVMIQGKTQDIKTQKPVTATLLINNYTANSQPVVADNGVYKVILPFEDHYTVYVYAEGYLSTFKTIEAGVTKQYTELTQDFHLIPVSVGDVLPLQQVTFQQGNDVLMSESYAALDSLVEMMKANPGMEIELAGYTDNVGNPASLVSLSQDRVMTVKRFLIEKGIDAKRITGKGYGSEKPIVKNDTEENRNKNRRVEFKITRLRTR